MKISKSGALFSSIVSIGEDIKKLSIKNNCEYLPLNRGVNSVVNIDLSKIKERINFNSDELQKYSPNKGILTLRKSISEYYFNNIELYDNITITSGGMVGLDMIFQILSTYKFKFPKFYWGSYSKLSKIRNVEYSSYEDLNDDMNNSVIIICDPSNPTGQKLDDIFLLNRIKELSKNNIIIFDSPYRRLFIESNKLFEELSNLDNVIICESFSKSFGVSGIRLGFLYSNNSDFNEELNIRMLYSYNGISSVSQLIINELIQCELNNDLVNPIKDFKQKTLNDISLNIEYLNENNLLSSEIYGEDFPIGIFASINKDYNFLLENKIGSVPMDKFTDSDKIFWVNHSRICVSVPNYKFIKFFKKFL